MRSIHRRTVLAAGLTAPALLAACANGGRAAAPYARELAAMRRATQFMAEEVAVNGGYVWSYLPDFSRRWGEMEAYPSMVWVQAPGTPQMGQVFLDAYRLTGDEYYYEAAARAADGLIEGQHESGGWNYMIDFAGEESIKRWYETIGANGWRLEEFQHYYGNATFDDLGTIESARFLLRLYLVKQDPKYRAALDRAINFILDSQYPSGGWPQRYPAPEKPFNKQGRPDYTGYVTLNDDVAEANIDFLLLVLQQLGEERVREPLQRAMDCFIALQQGQPNPGWSLQYTTSLEPAGARSYEPLSLSPETTGAALTKLMDFYELTGERKYLARIPEAIEWLDKVEAPRETHTADGRNHFRYIEIGTNRPLAVRRRGSNAQNGEYYVNYDMTGQKAEKRVDTRALRARYERLLDTPPEKATRNSVLLGRGPSLLPDYIITEDMETSDRNAKAAAPFIISKSQADAIIGGLNDDGYWPIELRATSHPYKGPGPSEPPPGFVDQHHEVGDEWDTSPFTPENGPIGISTGEYIRNMGRLIQYVATSSQKGDA